MKSADFLLILLVAVGIGLGIGAAITTALQGTAVAVTVPESSDLLTPEEPQRSGASGNPEMELPPGLSLEQIRNHRLSLKDALFYEKLPKKSVLCKLCPNFCRLAPGERGLCRVRVNIDGELKTLVYGKPIAMHIDPVEKKPLFHFYPGKRIFSIATAGCNLRCIFCQNWTISQAFPEDTDHTRQIRSRFPEKLDPTVLRPAELVNAAKSTDSKMIAYTYTEPSIFYEYMLDTAKLAKEAGLKNVLVTCGYINEEPLRQLCKYIDAANIDLKGFSDEFYKEYCGAKLQPVLDALKITQEEGVWLEVTNLVIPGANDSPQLVRDMCVWIKENLGTDVPLHFSRFHPDYKLRDRPATPYRLLTKCAEIAREVGLKYVYIGNVWKSGTEDTYCPECGKRLIERRGFIVTKNIIKDGKCPFCGADIPGRW